MREPTINFHRVGRQSLTSLKLRRLFDIYRIEKQNLIELELRFLSFKHHYFDPVYYLFSLNFMTRRQLLYEYKKSARIKGKTKNILTPLVYYKYQQTRLNGFKYGDLNENYGNS